MANDTLKNNVSLAFAFGPLCRAYSDEHDLRATAAGQKRCECRLCTNYRKLLAEDAAKSPSPSPTGGAK